MGARKKTWWTVKEVAARYGKSPKTVRRNIRSLEKRSGKTVLRDRAEPGARQARFEVDIETLSRISGTFAVDPYAEPDVTVAEKRALEELPRLRERVTDAEVRADRQWAQIQKLLERVRALEQAAKPRRLRSK